MSELCGILSLYIGRSLVTSSLPQPSLLLTLLEEVTANLDDNVHVRGGLMIDRPGVCRNCVAHFRRSAGSPTSMPFRIAPIPGDRIVVRGLPSPRSREMTGCITLQAPCSQSGPF
jgi:hypothetical protein